MMQIIYEPSFISKWYAAEAGKRSESLLDITHNLGEYPVKVDVQVKINENGKEYIFSGIGSSQRDDDLMDDFGGVVYRYNNVHIQLTFPYNNNGYGSNAGLAYTGSGTLYIGPTLNIPNRPYFNGFVRVRAWLASDMPQPVFNISANISSAGENYRELVHGLGIYPDIVTVRTLMSDGYMSDGIGVVFFGDNISRYQGTGGVLFGYDDQKIRLWIPAYETNKTNGHVFMATDGYSLGAMRSGTAKILGWTIKPWQHVFSSTTRVEGLNVESNVSISCSFNWTNYFLSVQYKIPSSSGHNGGMVFYAAGTTQASSVYSYGGIVYAYTEENIILWYPRDRPIVYIGGMWGQNQSSQISNEADVIIKIFYLKEQDCQYPDESVNAIFSMTGQRYSDELNYTCEEGYGLVGGNLSRTCGRSRKWSGYPPVCVEQQVCPNTTENHISTGFKLNIDEMRVDKTETSAYLRSKTSADDQRFSSRVIGVTGVFIIISFVAFLILPDVISVLRYVFCRCKKQKTT